MTDYNDNDNRIIPRIASEIVSSPFWHPCKFCGEPIVFVRKTPHDIGNYDERHRCRGTRESWLERLKEVDA